MEFQPGDLVTYKDQFTQSGNFYGAPVIMVLKTMIPRCPLGSDRTPSPRVFVHHLKKGIQGWDFASGYVKMPFKPD